MKLATYIYTCKTNSSTRKGQATVIDFLQFCLACIKCKYRYFFSNVTHLRLFSMSTKLSQVFVV